jgi:uncharacterized membrane protein (DUF485 family)
MKPSPDEAAGSPAAHADEHLDLSARNSRTGLWLFALYLTAYVVFVGMAAFGQRTMGSGVAILYGFGLIAGAVLLALVYMFLCKRNADLFEREGGGR